MKARGFITRRLLILIAVLLCMLTTITIVWYRRWKYPYYGRDHCCIKQIGVTLHFYAEKYGGSHPAGCATPEASLSLLCEEEALRNL